MNARMWLVALLAYGAGVTLGRRVEHVVEWESEDISIDVSAYLLGLTYTDNFSGVADDLALHLHDRDRLWAGDWRPETGDTVTARIRAEPWLTTVEDLRLGTFSHDHVTLAGPPRTMDVKAVSAPLATALRRRKRTRVWRESTLRQIAQDIATRADLDLEYVAADGPIYRHMRQHNQSDFEFLVERCKEAGLACKVDESAQTEGRFALIIFDELVRDTSTSIGTIDLEDSNVLSYSFESGDSDRYGSAHVKRFDPRTGKTHEHTFTVDEDGQTLELSFVVGISVDSIGAAERRAKAMLRARNRFADQGRLTVMGDPGLVAGVVFTLAGADDFDGRYIVEKAQHRTTGGYEVALDIRRTIEDGY